MAPKRKPKLIKLNPKDNGDGMPVAFFEGKPVSLDARALAFSSPQILGRGSRKETPKVE